MTAWPAYAVIVAPGDAAGDAPDVERTEWDDGHVRQAKLYTADRQLRQVTALVPGAELAAFRTWLRTNAHTWFDVADIDGRTVKMRVVGGAGGVAYSQVNHAGAEALWEARCQFETEG